MRASVCIVLVLSTVAPLAAQDSTAQSAPGPLCLHARPKPRCSAFFLTNVGTYVVLGGGNGSETSLRGVLDYGFMVNVNTRDAFGGSVFGSLDGDGFALGPAVRYRRWLTPKASFEVAVGTPLLANSGMHTGSVFGLVKWSPNHWFSLAGRPELIRQPQPVCGPSCSLHSRGRVSLGAEAGAVPGLVITGAAGVGFLAFLAILLSVGFGD